jgi:hypothetical protein
MWPKSSPCPTEFRELAPEFFYFCEILFAEQAELPQWAQSPFEFVYLHRKALESEVTSKNLHEWLNIVFGVKQKREMPSFGHPTVVFGQSHPKRGNPRFPVKSFVCRLEIGPLVFAHVFEANERSIGLTAIDSKGNFALCMLQFRDTQNGTQKLPGIIMLPNVDFGSPKVEFVGVGEKVLITAGKTVVYDTGVLQTFSRPGRSIAADSNWVIVPERNALISAFRSTNLFVPVWTVPHYNAKVVAACVSSEFHTYVLATKNSELLICPLERGSSVTVVSLEPCRVKRVTVTPAWGLIVVYFETQVETTVSYAIAVYTINGTKLKVGIITEEITAMAAWTSRCGFDWLALADRSGCVLCCEAYLLNFGKPLMPPNAGIVDLEYDREGRMLIAIARDGTVFCQTVEQS